MSNINTMTARLLLIVASVQLMLDGSRATVDLDAVEEFIRQVNRVNCTEVDLMVDRWRSTVKISMLVKQYDTTALYMNRTSSPCYTKIKESIANWNVYYANLETWCQPKPKGMKQGCIDRSKKILQCFAQTIIPAYEELFKKLRKNLESCLDVHPESEDSKHLLSTVEAVHLDVIERMKAYLRPKVELVAIYADRNPSDFVKNN